MTSPIRARRNRNRTRINAAGTVESVQPASASAIAGGGGANVQMSLDVRTAGDTQLIRQAVREGWPVPFEMKSQIVEHVADVAVNDENARKSISCMRLIVAMSAANLQAEIEAIKALSSSEGPRT